MPICISKGKYTDPVPLSQIMLLTSKLESPKSTQARDQWMTNVSLTSNIDSTHDLVIPHHPIGLKL